MQKNIKIQSTAIHICSVSLALTIIGLIFIYSSSSVFALEKCKDASFYLKKQSIGLVIACVAFCITRIVSLMWIRSNALLLFFSSWLLTAATLFRAMSMTIHGSSRWLTIFNQSFQPSELLKIGLIIYAARFLSTAETKKKSFVISYLPLLIILGMTSVLLLKQPDFGLTVTLLITVAAMLFVTELPLRYLAWTSFSLVPCLGILMIMRPYRLKRILTFLDPWADPRGSGFQIIQSLIAIGSGGLFGVGIGQSKQKFFYLPMQHTDFIFSIIAEETGLVGVIFLITLFLLFLYFGLKLASLVADRFCSLLCVGFTILITLEAAINIAVSAGLVPTKGIGMPFVSYGNSSLITCYIILGLLVSCAYQTKQTSAHHHFAYQ